MAPWVYRVQIEPAGHPGAIYHVRIWLARPVNEGDPQTWRVVHESQVDAGHFPAQPMKQWCEIMRNLKL